MSKPRLRCAIYTRKSSEEGLEQDYNSLHAQRDACEAYIKSQVGEGWTSLKAEYDDGGVSGGTMERDGLNRLLADIAARKIDVVVVYKVDRLTRSLGDFARIVEVFDKHGVSFVSVTQAFNTTTSMGRLTLNVLLSFAQFEREVTGERIRDKIAASKAKGMWMGGTPPLGYDVRGRTLEINVEEAELVRHIFRRYLEVQSTTALWAELNAEGRVSKSWTTSTGRQIGGRPFERGAVIHVLKNEVYLGLIRHKELIHPGLHPAIIDRETFDHVQASLKAKTRRVMVGREQPENSALLRGRIFDMEGVAMTPTATLKPKSGQRFRYYVSSNVQRGKKPSGSAEAIRRVPAPAVESLVRQAAGRLFPDHDNALALVARVEIHPRAMQIAIDPAKAAASQRAREELFVAVEIRLADGETWMEEGGRWWLRIGRRMQFRGGRVQMTSGGLAPVAYDAVLVRALRKAHAIRGRCTDEHGRFHQAPDGPHERMLVRLAFLAPDVQTAILSGSHRADLKLEDLRHRRLPLCWDDQRDLLLR